MADEPQQGDRRRGDDRREDSQPRASAWSDPKLWVSIFSVLIILGGALLHKINEVDDHVIALTLVTATKDQEKQDAIKSLEKHEDGNSAQINNNADMQMSYNASLYKALTEIITTMKLAKLPTPELPDPPKLRNSTR